MLVNIRLVSKKTWLEKISDVI